MNLTNQLTQRHAHLLRHSRRARLGLVLLVLLCHGGPLPWAVLGRTPEYLPHGRSQAGDRRLKIHEGWDNLRLRLALDNGDEVELDGGTLVLGDEQSSVLLRLAPWRARSVARVLEEWSAATRVFHRAPRPILTELELSRTLDLAASVLGEPEPPMPMQRGGQTVPSRHRLDTVAVLADRESRLSALQRLALVDAAASWLSEPNSGDQLAHALLAAACTTEVTAEHAYPALITPAENSEDHSEGLPS